MRHLELAAGSFAMLIVAVGMAFYEWSRVQSKRPLFKGRQIVTLYWMAYLSFFVLGITTGIAAIVR
jgi:hypothetical protein